MSNADEQQFLQFLEQHKANIQGNILRGFNKDNVRLIFFNIEDANKASRWFHKLVEQKRIPSTQDLLDAAKKLDETWDREPNFKPRETWIHVAFSANGIVKFGLELPPSHGAYGFDGNGEDIVLINGSAVVDDTDPFKKGMAGRKTELGDIQKDDPQNWIEPFNKKLNLIDGVIRIDADEPSDADKATVDLLVESSERGITSLGLQKGTAIFNPHGKQIEHFGFRDGVSQPLFKGIDNKEIEKRKIEKDFHDPKKFVLFDLTGNRSWANDGSFMVIRRLSQDFAGFWQFMNSHSEKFGLTPEGFAARFVGRWTSGAPLAKFPDFDPDLPEEFDDNDFVYLENKEEDPPETPHPELDDPRGNKTPRFAHIRKVYPRDDGFGSPDENDISSDQHRILRRGIPFGPLFANDPDADRGLIFMCYQIDLENQFEFIQRAWANNPNFPKKDDQPPPNGTVHGIDAIIGKHHDTGFVNLLQNNQFTKIDGFKQWITTTGGAYFFSPSISALKNLKVT
jgi:Dyp-type peroxidase family